MKTKPLLIWLSVLLSVFAPIMNYTFRLGYVMIDLYTFSGFAVCIFTLMVLNALFAIHFLMGYLKTRNPKSKLFIVSSVLAVIFTLLNFVNSRIVHMYTFWYYFGQMLPWLIAFIGVPILLFVFPTVERQKR